METITEETLYQTDTLEGLTVEEAFEIVRNDLKAIYNIKDAV